MTVNRRTPWHPGVAAGRGFPPGHVGLAILALCVAVAAIAVGFWLAG